MGKKERTRVPVSMPTTKALFAKSWNLCAFPGCTTTIISATGTVNGQICHIEAAEKGGERYNENMTPKERASEANLILLCYEHHKETNNVTSYTKEKLHEYKKNHENKLNNLLEMLSTGSPDTTAGQTAVRPLSLLSFDRKYGTYDTASRNTVRQQVEEYQDKLCLVPKETRKVLDSIVRHAKGSKFVSDEVIRVAVKPADDPLDTHLSALYHHGLIDFDRYDDVGNVIIIIQIGSDVSWKEFSQLAPGDSFRTRFIVDIDGTAMD